VWQRVRRPFRWCRLCLWSLTLVLLGSFIYFDTIGLPSFVRNRLVSELQARGVILNVSRLRLRWFRGLVADAVSFAGNQATPPTRFFASEVVLKPDWKALARLRFEVTALVVRNGRLEITVGSTNNAPIRFDVNRIQTELRLLPDDRWELDRFDAESLGTKLSLTGVLTNASAVRLWGSAPSTNQPSGAWQSYLREAVRLAGHCRFSEPPQLRVLIHGDAREPAGIAADARLEARNAETAWGGFDRMSLTARWNRTSPGSEGQSDLELIAEGIRSPWVQAQQSRLSLEAAHSPTNLTSSAVNWRWELNQVNTPWGSVPGARFHGRTGPSPDDPRRLVSELELDSGTLRSAWVDFETNRFSARIIHPPADFAALDSARPVHPAASGVPVEAEWRWTVTAPSSRWARASLFDLSGRLTRTTSIAPSRATPDWAWWSLLEPYDISWSAQVKGVTLTNLPLDEVSLAGRWQAPDLKVESLSARRDGHAVNGSFSIDVGTRRLEARLDSDFDWRALVESVPEEVRPWARPVQWLAPPRITAAAGLILPAWTNSQPDFQLEVLPSLTATGHLEVGQVSFQEFSLDSLQTHFSYSNLTLRVPDLSVVRPEGRADFDFTVHLTDHRYHCRLESDIDPLALRHLLKQTNSTLSELVQFSRPPRIDAELWGSGAAPGEASILAHVVATNFVFRGRSFDELSGFVQFTNAYLIATNVNVRAAAGTASAPGLGFDPASGLLSLTNVTGFIDPQFVFQCINPVLATNLSRYDFKKPPHSRVNGWIEVRRGRLADLRVDVAGGPFRYWKFNAPQISGTVLLQDERVSVTNLAADFYGGRLAGDVAVASTAIPNPDFRFAMQLAGADFRQFMADVSTSTNRFEGTFGGELTVTSANSADWGSWNGYGNVRLQDGYLWGIPLFGVFSPVLDALVPGLGQSRVSAGAASYYITNSVIHTRDLEIRSPAMRLAYQGTIDFDYRVDARVEARLLRDMWVVGPLVSLVFSPLTKLLEYKVTGTLGEPKLEPLHIPKALQFPLHPWRTLKELFTNEKPNPPPESTPAPSPPQDTAPPP